MRGTVLRRMISAFIMSTVALLPARAGGFDSPTVSARGAGMGGVSVVLTGDPTSASANPALLSYLRGTQFSIGTTVELPNFRFTTEATPSQSTKMQTQVLFPPNMCLTYTFESGAGFGVAVSNPYSSKTDWGTDWPGRNVITASEMRGFMVTPMASFIITRSVTAGIGVNITSFRFTRSSRVAARSGIILSEVEGTERMQGTGTPAFGVEAGLLVAHDDRVRLGIVYRSRSRVCIEDGFVSTDWPQASGDTTVTSQFTTSFTLPDRFLAGLSFRPFDFILLGGELEFVRWSSIDRIELLGAADRRIIDQQGWKDVLAARAGVEISLGGIALRAGIILDPSSVNDNQARPSLPDGNRTAYTFGIGYGIGEGLMMDVALQTVKHDRRAITNSDVISADGTPLNGVYDMSATNVCLNVSYSWK
jgi:long-chain fatty acid transport protein